MDFLAGKRRPIDYKTNTFIPYPSLDSLADKVKVPIFVVENAEKEFWLLTPGVLELDGCTFSGGIDRPEIIQTLNPGDSCFDQVAYEYGGIQGLEAFLEIGKMVRMHYVWQEAKEEGVEVHRIVSNWLDLREYFRMEFE
ncbi:MAG: hypothetical protein AAF804_08415 [Bacteroidota bacterium]